MVLTMKQSLALLLLALPLSCAPAALGASSEGMARARVQSTRGSDLFEQHCSSCHGERGEGTVSAPAVLGMGALPEFPRERDVNTTQAGNDPELLKAQALTRPAGAPSRDPFRTADDLHRFVSTQMPRPKARMGTLTADEYWEIVSFMLIAQGASIPTGGVRQNASAVRVPH
jgi:mono/diheme cytochrome c family protein